MSLKLRITTPRKMMLHNQFRQNFYILIGVSLGLLFGIFNPLQNDCGSMGYSKFSSMEDEATMDEYVLKVNSAAKPVKAQKNPQKILRPRYFSTELGIRKKLFVAVLTTQRTINSFGVAVNKTASHLVDKLTFFIDAHGTQKLNVSYLKLPGIVGFIDTRVVLKPFHVLKYIKDNYIDSYDFFFIVNDNVFVKARKLNDIVEQISISEDIYASTKIPDSKYCSFDAGFLLSNSVVQRLVSNIDWCVKNVRSASDDENFGECVLNSSNIECQQLVQGQYFSSYHLRNESELGSRNLESDEMYNAFSVYPIKNKKTFYTLHAYFSKIELEKTNNEISRLRESMEAMAKFTSDGDRSITWPVGNQPGNKPNTRFDLLRWDYFTQSHIYLTNEFNTLRKLNEAEKLDIQIVINSSVEMFKTKYNQNYEFYSLVNGYRRFDPSRGMDYKLDIALRKIGTDDVVHKRVEICKPLGKVELLSMPYVTENRRVNIILPVHVDDRANAVQFLEQYKTVCLEKKEKIFLVLVFIYDFNAPGKNTKDDVFKDLKNQAQMLSQMYKRDENRIIWLSIKLPFTDNLVISTALLKFAILDLSLKKFPYDSLILFATPSMEIRVEYLNRVRMNTILGWQIFCPIPFFEYNPIITGTKQHQFIDVNKKYGHFDSLNTDHISFYVKDYFSTRKNIETLIPLVRNDADMRSFRSSSDENFTSLAVDTVYSMFVRFGDVHVIRGVEPTLKLRHYETDCTAFMSIADKTVAALYKHCLTSRNMNLGSRSQLSRLLLDYQETSKINLLS